jgi:uncharacterized protein (DUF2141 family)
MLLIPIALQAIFGETFNQWKKIALMIFAVTGIIFGSWTQATLEVRIKNVATNVGLVRVALYESEKDFLKTAIKTQSIQADGDEIVFVFENIHSGDYALSSYHDKNSNAKLDTNWVGVPSEPYGFSNDARGMFGLPSFNEAKFSVKEGSNLAELKVK